VMNANRTTLNRLVNRHRFMNAQINKEMRRANPDVRLVQTLKRKRVHLKNAATRLRVEINQEAPKAAV
ncbi:MAG: DUF465 domain-containing protein, partial [Pseudomonadota bacterium]